MKKFPIYIILFLLGGFSYYLIFDQQVQRDLKNYQTSSTIRKVGDNKYISPLLLTGDTLNSRVNDDFTEKISDYIKVQKRNGNAIEISYYVKNLRNSSWVGINEDTHYMPASLMKVPVLIAILKENERDQNLLKKKIIYKESQNYNNEEYYAPKKSIIKNNTYSVEELLTYMIDYSDNNATVLLLSLIPRDKIVQIFTDLDLPLPQSNTDSNIDFISTKLYSRLFRVLYNSTYLNEDDSAKALQLLSNIDFPNGIIAGVPQNVEVSNKFGERTIYDSSNNFLYRELHDCGIVYLTDNPYTVCIMTKGDDFAKLENIIKNLSQMTYEELK